jgi:hypothetical protein
VGYFEEKKNFLYCLTQRIVEGKLALLFGAFFLCGVFVWQYLIQTGLPFLYDRPLGSLALTDSSLYMSLTFDILHGIPISHLKISHSWTSLLFAYFLYPFVRIGIEPLYFNYLLVIGAILGITRISRDLKVPAALPLSVVIFNPLTFFFLQTFTKEMFILSCLPWFYISVHRKNPYVGLCALIGIASARLYFLAPLFLSLFFAKFIKKNWQAALTIVALLLCLPLYYSNLATSFLEASKGYFAESGRGLSYTYVSLLDKPILAALIIPLRVIQVVLEPFFSRTPIVDHLGSVNISYLSSLGGASVLLVVLAMAAFFAKKTTENTEVPEASDQLEKSTLWFTISVIIIIAALPFIHNRYIYSVLPFLVIQAFKAFSWVIKTWVKFATHKNVID